VLTRGNSRLIQFSYASLGRDNANEEAIVTLPIHPLRVRLVRKLYSIVTNLGDTTASTTSTRFGNIIWICRLYVLLTPINVPAFSYHIGTSTTFYLLSRIFASFMVVALPAGVPDPHRRYGDIAILFGMTVDQGAAGDTHPEYLAEASQKLPRNCTHIRIHW